MGLSFLGVSGACHFANINRLWRIFHDVQVIGFMH